jgi:hypothetical protein
MTDFVIDIFRYAFNNIPLTRVAIEKSGIQELFPDFFDDIMHAVADAQIPHENRNLQSNRLTHTCILKAFHILF